jgi:hypothetical protein
MFALRFWRQGTSALASFANSFDWRECGHCFEPFLCQAILAHTKL